MKEILRFDPEGLMPPTLEVQDDVEKQYSLHVNHLTEEQFEALSKNLTEALQGRSRSLAARIASQVIGIAFTMIVVAACIWVVAFLISSLPGR